MSNLRRRSLLGTAGGTPWDGFLYKDGDEYVSVTGGWSADGYSYNNNQAILAAEKQATSIYGAPISGLLSGRGVGMGTVNLIDLTNFSSLKWKMMGYQGAIMVTPSKVNFVSSYVKYGEFTAIQEPTIQTIDISSLSGSYYVVTYIMDNGSGPSRFFTTMQMWVE